MLQSQVPVLEQGSIELWRRRQVSPPCHTRCYFELEVDVTPKVEDSG